MKLKLGGIVEEIDLVVFDCDGVLLDTMQAKIKAFETWVPKTYDAHGEAFMKMVMHGFGRSRQHHIASFYREIVGIQPGPEFLNAEVARFTEICEPLCAAANWRTGSKEFVMRCIEEEVIRYVLSGTPQKPLEDMLRSNGGASLFHLIIGSPPAKPESMERILVETGTPPGRCIFIGDANADRLAAEHVGARFVYFPSEAARPEGEITTEVNDLRELLVERG